MGEYYYFPAVGAGIVCQEPSEAYCRPKSVAPDPGQARVDFWPVLCHNLVVSAPSPITDRELLTGQLYADETPPAIRTAAYQRYTISPLDGVRWVPHAFPRRGGERVADVAAPVATM
jgi:hypothetical protein